MFMGMGGMWQVVVVLALGVVGYFGRYYIRRALDSSRQWIGNVRWVWDFARRE